MSGILVVGPVLGAVSERTVTNKDTGHTRIVASVDVHVGGPSKLASVELWDDDSLTPEQNAKRRQDFAATIPPVGTHVVFQGQRVNSFRGRVSVSDGRFLAPSDLRAMLAAVAPAAGAPAR